MVMIIGEPAEQQPERPVHRHARPGPSGPVPAPLPALPPRRTGRAEACDICGITGQPMLVFPPVTPQGGRVHRSCLDRVACYQRCRPRRYDCPECQAVGSEPTHRQDCSLRPEAMRGESGGPDDLGLQPGGWLP